MITDKDIKEIFEKYRTIAVYGMSKNQEKPSHYVPAFLHAKGYTIIPVNPSADEIINLKCYSSLKDIPVNVDIVEVFRPSDQVLDVVNEALERNKEKKDIFIIWLQEGIYNNEAKKLAEDAGLIFVDSRCMYKDYKHIFIGQNV
jgi:predicted CoA-binding protein